MHVTTEVVTKARIAPPEDPAQDIGFYGEGDWRIGNKQLVSTGASTCLILAAYNRRSKCGLMGHFASLITEDVGVQPHITAFTDAIDSLPDLGPKHETDIWLGAGAPYLEDDEDQNEVNRDAATMLVLGYLDSSNLSPKHFSVGWADKDMVTSAKLYCRYGRLAVEHFPRA